MKYYVYDSEKGYEEFDLLDDAVNRFQKMEFESRYTALGITEGVSAIDTVFKQKLDGKLALKASSDFLSSGLYGKKPKEVISELVKIHKQLNIPQKALEDILSKLDEVNKTLVDEIEMMWFSGSYWIY